MHAFIVTYDIADPKRLRRVYDTMRGYGAWLQLSVFRCELTERALVELRVALADIIHHEEDQVLFIDVAKTWRINDVVIAQFFPKLIPGHSIIIQQDYMWGFGPWIHITMALLATTAWITVGSPFLCAPRTSSTDSARFMALCLSCRSMAAKPCRKRSYASPDW